MSDAKNVILLRHGECETNRTEVYQAGDQFEIDPLDEVGEGQALAVADRFSDVPLEVIISTSYLRGLQTAMPIHNVTGAPIVVPVTAGDGIEDLAADDPTLGSRTSLLRELDLPSELAGLDFKDPAAEAIKDIIKEHIFDPRYRYSDEENLYDVWERAGLILEYLENRLEQTIAVVAHGGILKACLGRILLKHMPADTPTETLLRAYESFSAQTWWDNTGVVSLQHSSTEDWQWLMTDNQHIGPVYFAFMQKPEAVPAHEQSDTAPGDV